MVDMQAGLTQYIPCFQESIAQCHYAQTTICELVHKCDMPNNGNNLVKKLNWTYCYCCITADDSVLRKELGDSADAEFEFCTTNAALGQAWTKNCECSGPNCPSWVEPWDGH